MAGQIHFYFQVCKSPCCGCSHVCGSHLMVVQCLPPAPQSLALLDCSIYRIECDVFVLASSSSISMKVWVGSKSQQVWFTSVCCICVCLCIYCSGEVVLDMFSTTIQLINLSFIMLGCSIICSLSQVMCIICLGWAYLMVVVSCLLPSPQFLSRSSLCQAYGWLWWFCLCLQLLNLYDGVVYGFQLAIFSTILQ